MDLSQRLSISYYKTVTAINEEHKIYLVQHQETGKIYVKISWMSTPLMYINT